MTEAEAVAALRVAGIEAPARDVQKLLSHAIESGKPLAELIGRRVAHEPVSHILGYRPFWTSDFLVNRHVLDPRPDTETLVEAALATTWQSVLDLGTGSGCILLSLLKDRGGSTGLGSDISPEALQVAQSNAERLRLNDNVQFVLGDWFDAITGRFDLIVSNPPYITADAYRALDRGVRDYEPRLALTPGGDGLDAYRTIAARASQHLTPGGQVMVEIGFDQAAAVSSLFDEASFAAIRVLPDINGKDRVIAASFC